MSFDPIFDLTLGKPLQGRTLFQSAPSCSAIIRNMNIKNYYIAITWRETEASCEILENTAYEDFKRSMIDEGFSNLQTEWYEPGKNQLPDRYVAFIYWEYPNTAPAFENIKSWALNTIQKSLSNNA